LDDSCDVTRINGEAVENVRSQMLSRQLVAYTAEIFKALGDPTRLRLSAPHQGRPAKQSFTDVYLSAVAFSSPSREAPRVGRFSGLG